MNIPILDLRRQYATIRSEIDAAIHSVLESGEFILGPHVKQFEDEAAAYCRAKHAIGLASGTDALLLALRALGIGPGDAVLVPSFTFFATAGVVHNVGATPIFCDIDPETYNLDPESARRILEARSTWPVARRDGHVACGMWPVGKADEHVARSSWPVACGKIRDSETMPHGVSPTSHRLQATSGPSSHGPQATSYKPRVKAIIPVHLYGQMADMDEIMTLAREYDLAVIEDAAQAIGAQYATRVEHVACGMWPVGKADEPVARSMWPVGTAAEHVAGSAWPVGTAEAVDMVSPQATGYKPQAVSAGTLGSIGCFSFYPTKNLGAYGDAGMVTTNDNALAEKIRLLRVHGAKPKYVHHVVGINSRLDALQAVILSVKLKHLDAWSTARQRLADRYDEHLAGVPGIVTPHRAPDRTHIFHQYTLRVTDGKRDAFAAHLKNLGIGTMIYYPGPLHLQECFAHLGYHEGDFPESERASREVLSLPMFPEMTTEEQDRVVAAVRQFTTRSALSL
jgi:dTDP-4-amino-4,6-dideoxygalactose transaminase